NLEFARMIFNNNVDPDFARKLFALESVKASTLKKYYDSKNETELEYIYNFLIYGIFRLIHVWLNKEVRESPEEFAKMVIRLRVND
ncbi:MAG: TetR family transcriptional regulator C-terminal domain-containing protein, partial [Parasporobacterium sp.]|nr:TetR family transcriptional regulator C-terminal domain-containing protein [Parasporobacterium sp.]